jgi:hypothetical protein
LRGQIFGVIAGKLEPHVPLFRKVWALRMAFRSWEAAYSAYGRLFPLEEKAPFFPRAGPDESPSDCRSRVVAELIGKYREMLERELDVELTRRQEEWVSQQQKEFETEYQPPIEEERKAATDAIAAFAAANAAELRPVEDAVLVDIDAKGGNWKHSSSERRSFAKEWPLFDRARRRA